MTPAGPIPIGTAQQVAWSLVTSLMVCITLFKTDGGFGVLPTDEFDGDPILTVHEYDPFGR